MANVRLFGETSGFVELAAPNAAGNNTITLPTTGTELVASDGTGDITFAGTVTASGLTVDSTATLAGTVTASGLTLDSTATFAVGASGTPAITASGDPNTGIYFPAADTIGFAEGGNEAARIDSSGRQLVGATTARANFNNTTDTTRFQVEGIDAATSSISLVCNNGGGVPVASVHLAKSDGSATGSNGAVGGNWNIGDIRFSGNDGAQFVEAARIEAEIDATPGADNMPGRIAFLTTQSSASSPSERMRLRNNGNLRINMADFGADVSGSNTGVEFTPGSFPVFRISSGDATTNAVAVFFNTNGAVGSIQTSGSSTLYNTSSDYRLKENVVDLDGAINRLKQLAPKRFNFIADAETTVDGFIAHEAQTVVPEAISGLKDEIAVWKEGDELPDGVSVGDNKLDEDGNTIPVYQGIDQSKLVPLLTAALQEAIGKIETLETANASLEARLTALESA